MRLENLIFLIFLVAIAITLGSTLAIVSSLSAQASFQDTMGTNASSQSLEIKDPLAPQLKPILSVAGARHTS